MKPRKLIIKGLNSFVEEQTIDFESLTAKGLFGIFGPTGSGKSTILDAITLALYGDISRDSKEYINSFCSGVSVSYEFEIGAAGYRKIYVADRVVNKDKNGLYKLKTCRLLEKGGEDLIPIAEGARDVKAKVEEIIGLKSEDFTRSVVLPQGRFSDFLKLSGVDRRNMLERIFNLKKYGIVLSEKIKKERKVRNEELSVLNTRIDSISVRGVSKENYKLIEDEINRLKTNEVSIRNEKENIDKQYEHYNNLWSLKSELLNYEDKQKELLKEKCVMDEKSCKVLKGKRANLVKPFIDDYIETEESLLNLEKQYTSTELSLNDLEKNIEESKKSYKEALILKDKELPILIEKETQAKRAFDLEKSIQDLKRDRDELRNNFIIIRDKLNKLNVLEEESKIIISESNVSIEDLENKIEASRVDPEIREKVLKGSIMYMEKVKKIEEKDKLQNRYNKIYKDHAKCKEEKVLLEDIIINIEKDIKEIEQKLKAIENDFSKDKDNSVDLEKRDTYLSMAVTQYEEIITSTNKIEGDIESIKIRNVQISDEKVELEDQKELLKVKLNKVTREIESLNKENLAYSILEDLKEGDSCPVCGSTHHIKYAESKDESLILESNNLKEEYEGELLKVENNLKDIESNIIKNQTFEETYLAELKRLKFRLESLNLNDFIDLEGRAPSPEYLYQYYENFKKEHEEIKVSRELHEKKKEGLEGELKEKKDILSINKLNYEKIKSELSSEEKGLINIKDDIDEILENIISLEIILKDITEEINIEDFTLESKNVTEKDKLLSTFQNENKELKQRLDKYQKQNEQYKRDINLLNIEKAKIEESGKEKKLILDKYISEREILTEGKDAKDYIKEIINRKQFIISNEANLKRLLEELNINKISLNDKYISLKQNLLNLKDKMIRCQDNLLNALKENQFESKEEVITFVIDEAKVISLENEIDSYEKSLNDLKSNIKNINLKLNGQDINKDLFEEVKHKRSYLSGILEDLIKSVASKEQVLKDMERDLKELKDIQKQQKSMAYLCSNLDELTKLIEGNKFVEYVAQSQLKYICIEASKRLKDITRGRYALELDESGGFIMRDDFNGGYRRSASTLSGGETFLTSLALALSLSSQIQLKGSAPLEFFFLDEGFGSLDTSLIDTVISSLESLRSDKLSIGLISHVEDLKNRVPIKLIVDNHSNGKMGSFVKIELT
ncbi:exonuclease [Clostridium putrefaciens]|uniref:Nuclease SbcCD subunit C n=1 Tax=Clostridium putrefaciens TaxID=99675 RepID=A0A381J5Y5_9CLOT|nr:AAA family ATPase [Clostridium putrefaciens]SUY44874.1 exonuclease [Clostridium putrefaciens]